MTANVSRLASITPPAVAFRIYDADDDGFVTRADLLHQLQQTNRRGLAQPQLEQIVGSTLAAFDSDGDGQLSYEEFRALLSASSTERNKALNF
jgi:serine/threonine-protein phosphatase 2B regulatory subunit